MKLKILILSLSFITLIFARKTDSQGQVIWKINSTSKIADNAVKKIGTPEAVAAGKDTVVRFNGKSDGLMVDANPLSGAKEFTVEIMFKPAEAAFAENHEQRFLHIQRTPARRVLIELRITKEGKWFLDTFLKSDTSSRTLYSEDITHPTGRWYCAELVYKNGIMKDYVDGKEEHSGRVNFLPMKDGKISIGVRKDLRS